MHDDGQFIYKSKTVPNKGKLSVVLHNQWTPLFDKDKRQINKKIAGEGLVCFNSVSLCELFKYKYVFQRIPYLNN